MLILSHNDCLLSTKMAYSIQCSLYELGVTNLVFSNLYDDELATV